MCNNKKIIVIKHQTLTKAFIFFPVHLESGELEHSGQTRKTTFNIIRRLVVFAILGCCSCCCGRFVVVCFSTSGLLLLFI